MIYTSQWEKFVPGFKKEAKISIKELFGFKHTKNYSIAQKLHVTENQKNIPQENIALFHQEVNNTVENSGQSISNKSMGTEVLRTELLNITKLNLSWKESLATTYHSICKATQMKKTAFHLQPFVPKTAHYEPLIIQISCTVNPDVHRCCS